MLSTPQYFTANEMSSWLASNTDLRHSGYIDVFSFRGARNIRIGRTCGMQSSTDIAQAIPIIMFDLRGVQVRLLKGKQMAWKET